MTERAAHSVEVEPIAVGAAQAAELFAVSERKWRGMDAAGLVPMPIRLGQQPRWCVAELRRWASAGAPPRAEWERMRHDEAASCTTGR